MGMSRGTGKSVVGIEHIHQSISDIVSTPIGTRAGGMVTDARGRRRHIREYGLDLVSLIDKPMTPALRVLLIAKLAHAVDTWEPRFRLGVVNVEMSEPGHLTVSLGGVDLISGKPAQLEGIDVVRAAP